MRLLLLDHLRTTGGCICNINLSWADVGMCVYKTVFIGGLL